MAKQELTAQALKAFIDASPDKYLVGDIKGDGYPSTGQLANLLMGSYAEIDNPEPAPQVPAPLTFDGLLSQAAAFVNSVPNELLTDLLSRIERQDRTGISQVAAVLLSRKTIDDAAHAAVSSVLAATVNDPSHPVKVPEPPDAAKFDGIITEKLIAEALGRSSEVAALDVTISENK